MAMIFEHGMNKTLRTYECWWDGKLGRPLIPIIITHDDVGKQPPRYPYKGQLSFGNLQISPRELVDSVDYVFDHSEYLGDAFPHFCGIYSGPGILAAFLGANIIYNNEGRIWFRPKSELTLREMHFTYDADNPWYLRTRAILDEAYRCWGDNVVIGMPDLGGVLDVLATFRGTQNLLYDLYDEPEEVLRLVGEIKELWHRYYDEIATLVPHGRTGYADWSNILSQKRSYMTQCDFCYMLSTDMFNRFVKAELRDTCNFLERGCYHLDGVGQIPHLDSLLEIESLDLVQWVPGDGTTDAQGWEKVYRKILDSGKHLQIVYASNEGESLRQLDNLISLYGTGNNIVHGQMLLQAEYRDEALEIISRYGAE